MSTHQHESPPRRETLASMAEEIFTEMRTRSADPLEDDTFIRRASSGRTAECIEGPVRRGQQGEVFEGAVRQRTLLLDPSSSSSVFAKTDKSSVALVQSPAQSPVQNAGKDSPRGTLWEESADTKLTVQFVTGSARQLIFPAPIHGGIQPQREPALCKDNAAEATCQEREAGRDGSVLHVHGPSEKGAEEWIPAHEVYNDKYAIPKKQRLPTDLSFESRFESGNLASAVRCSALEYNLYLRADKGTGACQWYYFMVANMDKDIRYKFNIMHFYKEKSMYHHGLRPLLWSQKCKKSGNKGWRRAGNEITYCENGVRRKNGGRNFTLSFKITFLHGDDVCFLAMCYPFTYSDLGLLLMETELLAAKSRIFMRSELCKTEAGNNCEIITICNPPHNAHSQTERRPVFFISGRVHPGESNSSYIVKGIIQFLVGNHDVAQALRKYFVFEIIPMLNPDGVIHGHYRVSQSGDDLNRNWTDPSRERHPTIYHAKKRLKSLAGEGRLLLFCDVHGHSTKKNVFMYGCNSSAFGSSFFGSTDVHHRGLRREQQFPKLFSERCSFVSFKDCHFDVDKKKENTGRAAVARECALVHSYTLEASFCGSDLGGQEDLPGHTSLDHFTAADLEGTGVEFCKTLAAYAAGSEHGWDLEDAVARAMQRALQADGPPPGASVLDLYYENLKKIETQKAQSRIQSPALTECASATNDSSNILASLPNLSAEDSLGRQASNKDWQKEQEMTSESLHLYDVPSVKDASNAKNVGLRRSSSEASMKHSNAISPGRLRSWRVTDADDDERARTRAIDRFRSSHGGLAPKKHSIDEAICAVFGERYTQPDTHVLLMTESERRRKEEAEPGLKFVRIPPEFQSSRSFAHAGIGLDRIDSSNGNSTRTAQAISAMSLQNGHGKRDSTLQSKDSFSTRAQNVQAEAGAHDFPDRMHVSSLAPFTTPESSGDASRRNQEVKRLSKYHPCTQNAAVEQAAGDRGQSFFRISPSRLAEMRERGTGSRTSTPTGNDLLPPVLWRHDSTGLPVQRDTMNGGLSPLYCTLHGRSSPDRSAVRSHAVGGRAGWRSQNNVQHTSSSKGRTGSDETDKAPQAFEPRVGGYNSSDSIDVGRAEDELLQRLHRLVARGSNGVETSTPMMTRPRAILAARTQSSRGSLVMARQSLGLADLSRSKSSLPNSRAGGLN